MSHEGKAIDVGSVIEAVFAAPHQYVDGNGDPAPRGWGRTSTPEQSHRSALPGLEDNGSVLARAGDSDPTWTIEERTSSLLMMPVTRVCIR
ncbi:hypothetical protein [Streptomyces sp. NPDC005953]|uniref:hypothetical protein n=1 Tax=Streptomyces sp. NPDC005953 TaxID=3156719 RepID=UPI0033F25952